MHNRKLHSTHSWVDIYAVHWTGDIL